MRNLFLPGRSPTLARDAAVATSHPLATSAALAILADGGNAVDAAIAAVAVQCVVEPHMTGIAGDCFAIYAPAGGAPVALNGSGRAPAGASVARLTEAGLTEIPQASPHAVTVPGAISAWTTLHGDHGRLPLERVFAAAIDYAENGYPVTARVAADWALAEPLLNGNEGAKAILLPGGRAPRFGERHSQPRLGARLREVATGGAAAFYTGATARAMVAALSALGGVHTEEDFANGTDTAVYVDPIGMDYRGYEVLECPPNGQGVVALLILNILSQFDLGPDVPLAERIHIHAEATKQAYHHRDELLGDPAGADDLVERLLSPARAEALAARIQPGRAGPASLWDEPEHKDTVYLCVVDGDGNAVSFINSLFHGFGSGIMDPETGVLFHSRGASFRLIEGHPNALMPGRRPMHTIIPAMLRREGRTVMPFGVMGGHYQAAGQAAFLSGMLDQGLDVQAAMDAPRAFAFGGKLQVEPTVDEATRETLRQWGHAVDVVKTPIGGSQAIWIGGAGVLLAGSDQRKDGLALGF